MQDDVFDRVQIKEQASTARCNRIYMLHVTVHVQQPSAQAGFVRIQKLERAHVLATCTAYYLPSSLRSLRGSIALYIVLVNNVMYSFAKKNNVMHSLTVI